MVSQLVIQQIKEQRVIKQNSPRQHETAASTREKQIKEQRLIKAK
jgi:hypothetical protein